MAEEKTQTEQVEQNNPEKEGMEADGSFKVEENVVGNFKAKEHKEEEKKKPNYQPLNLGNEDNISDWLVGMLSGRLQDWFIGNLELVGYYADKMLDKANKAIDRRHEKDKLGLNKDANKNKENKEKGKDNPNKTSAKERNEAKAKNAQNLADKAKKNLENRSYDNSTNGKNQKAFDQMTVQSLQHEADYRKKVAENPAYAKSKEGRAARAELIGDRKALAAMQKETGVNDQIVKGSFEKKGKENKADKKGKNKNAKREKVGLKVAGAAAKEQKGKIAGKKKKAQQQGMKKTKQKNNIKGLSKLKSQMKKMHNQRTNPTRQQNRNLAQVRNARRGRG